MIIPDLSHLEVVSEVPSVVGGAKTKTTYTTADQVLPQSILKLLSPAVRAQLKKTKGKAVSTSDKKKNTSTKGNSSATTYTSYTVTSFISDD